ncbi:hypothetical protein CAI21_01425 [Alkalilimnicola ehrlichii]|uniref:Uncharacterized protein n=1 Tax=Alkalilimnicola ehrlichii TaxID=351052 RepID=A0A3E0X184_9GAMM|nr:hypothetical protein [Alkalilimnicola ehrlichii]RFA31317.1 hypothetical protein CAI21_01425 [Alkalilimnicola ehrlichii]RFA39409.1 hypothetical protein CAL65_00985 [Alkalilimnicola ehrlichii]
MARHTDSLKTAASCLDMSRTGLIRRLRDIGLLGPQRLADEGRAPNNKATRCGHNKSEKTMAKKRQHTTPLPQGTLHDAGELTVVTQDGERVHHRAALVLVFDSTNALQRAIDAHRCSYRVRRDMPEAQLHLGRSSDQ